MIRRVPPYVWPMLLVGLVTASGFGAVAVLAQSGIWWGAVAVYGLMLAVILGICAARP
jgi:hypothetical protein